jgi:hypothetical protein
MCVWQIDILEVEGVYYGTFMSSRLCTLLLHVVKETIVSSQEDWWGFIHFLAALHNEQHDDD